MNLLTILWQFCPANLAFVPQPLALGSEMLFCSGMVGEHIHVSHSVFLSSIYQHL